MSIYQKPLDDLALLLSTAAGVAITSSHFTIRGFKAVTDPSYNTKVNVLFNATAPIAGDKTFMYNRLSLASLINLNTMRATRRSVTPVGQGVSVYTLFPELRDTLGIQFDTNELEETFAADDGVGISIKLKAKTTSLGWVGEYIQTFSYNPNIATAFFSAGLKDF